MLARISRWRERHVDTAVILTLEDIPDDVLEELIQKARREREELIAAGKLPPEEPATSSTQLLSAHAEGSSPVIMSGLKKETDRQFPGVMIGPDPIYSRSALIGRRLGKGWAGFKLLRSVQRAGIRRQ